MERASESLNDAPPPPTLLLCNIMHRRIVQNRIRRHAHSSEAIAVLYAMLFFFLFLLLLFNGQWAAAGRWEQVAFIILFFYWSYCERNDIPQHSTAVMNGNLWNKQQQPATTNYTTTRGYFLLLLLPALLLWGRWLNDDESIYVRPSVRPSVRWISCDGLAVRSR